VSVEIVNIIEGEAMRRLETIFWWPFSGAALLLLISVYGLYSHRMERQHRHEVVTHGTQTNARVVKSSGIEAVLITWTDSAGRSQTADAWTGKPFARLAHTGQNVAIKYLPKSTLEPVILSEAAERDRVNAWWIGSNTGVAIAMTIICVVIGRNVRAGTYRARA
jgi:hypothetical protein